MINYTALRGFAWRQAMNESMGLLGRKLGATQIFGADGSIERVTAIEVGPCTVINLRTADRDGYTAVVLGFEEGRQKGMRKPVIGQFTKDGSSLKEKGVTPKRTIHEVRVPRDLAGKYEVGQTISVAEVFEKGQFVDVTGRTKGRGFAGVVKRYGFKGPNASHGTHEYFRHGGSIGQNMTPGHTFKGLRMPGHYGNERMTVQNLRVVDVLADKNVLLVCGAVPGPTRSLVMIRRAVKKQH